VLKQINQLIGLEVTQLLWLYMTIKGSRNMTVHSPEVC